MITKTHRHGTSILITTAFVTSVMLVGCDRSSKPAKETAAATTAAEASATERPKAGPRPAEVYWGDTHLHTRNSPDANLTGNVRLTPDDAYRFAAGAELEGYNGEKAKLARPLDWLVVSDHAEYIGLVPRLREGDAALLESESAKRWSEMMNKGGEDAYQATMELVGTISSREEKMGSPAIKKSVWADAVAAADRNNKPGTFTAFAGFEWTTMPDGDNLHRIIIFADGANKVTQVLPYSAFDSEDPEDLWAYLADYEKKTGGKVLALAHNGNVSNGRMFELQRFNGEPFNEAYVRMRHRWEPLYEVTQIKGDGETHPFLSPNDEFADYETWDKGNLLGYVPKKKSMLKYEYARSALLMGLEQEEKLGTNPFKFGLVGSTDAHTAFAAVDEDNFWGKITLLEPSKDRVQDVIIESPKDPKLSTFGWEMVSSGYAAVWATENTRAALYDAMKRRETYATTGPRMIVRFFGGWDFVAADAKAKDIAGVGYEKGVPMGGDITNAPKGGAPSFLIAASKDPVGANLDRVQVIKGWLDAKGKTREKVYNVALSDGRTVGKRGKVAPVGNTVNVKDAIYENSIGDPALAVVWTDPDFDPKERAFYYVRVIEIPTPRWTAFDARRYGAKVPKESPMTTQERAYTSPIWYTP